MAAMKQYTWEEVARNNGRKGAPLWLVYKDIVMDLTNFENEHPGGADALREEAGGDCSKLFDEVGHSSDAKKLVQKYKIGEIVEAERRYANGKRIIQVNNDGEQPSEGRSCLSILTCGLIGS